MTKVIENLANFKAKVPVQINGEWTQKTIFKNGVEHFDTINSLYSGDTDDAQDLFDAHIDYLKYYINIDDVYEKRDERITPFLGTYAVVPKLNHEYASFLNRFAHNGYDKLVAKMLHESDDLPTFDEWRSGKKSVNGRTMNLGKWLRSLGATDSLVSFYASQSKEEKKVYLTISDSPLHILGMSTFGTDWSSCQSLESDGTYNIGLAGSLIDTKLVVAFLHDSLEDLEDFEDKVIGRTVMRLFKYGSEDMLFSTSLYGNSHNKKMLENVLKELECIGIMGLDAKKDVTLELSESNDSLGCSVTITDEVYVSEELEEWVDVPCILCGGDGDYEVYSDVFDREMSIECPNCCGEGTTEELVTVSIDTYVEMEDEVNAKPYVEGYSSYESHTSIRINDEYIDSVYNVVLDEKEVGKTHMPYFLSDSSRSIGESVMALLNDTYSDKDVTKSIAKLMRKYSYPDALAYVSMRLSERLHGINSGTNGANLFESLVAESIFLGDRNSSLVERLRMVKSTDIIYSFEYNDTVEDVIFSVKAIHLLSSLNYNFIDTISSKDMELYQGLELIARNVFSK